jgi:hypothetical protein
MSKVTLTFEVEEDVGAVLAESAKARGEDVAQLLRSMVEDYVHTIQTEDEHDAWFRREVQEGLREANDPNAVWIPHEEVVADMERQRADLLRRAAEQEQRRARTR